MIVNRREAGFATNAFPYYPRDEGEKGRKGGKKGRALV